MTCSAKRRGSPPTIPATPNRTAARVPSSIAADGHLEGRRGVYQRSQNSSTPSSSTREDVGQHAGPCRPRTRWARPARDRGRCALGLPEPVRGGPRTVVGGRRSPASSCTRMVSTRSQICSAARGRASPLKPGSIPLVKSVVPPAAHASASARHSCLGSAAGRVDEVHHRARARRRRPIARSSAELGQRLPGPRLARRGVHDTVGPQGEQRVGVGGGADPGLDRPRPARSPASRPTRAALWVYTPTSSNSLLPTKARETPGFPTPPVDHCTTRYAIAAPRSGRRIRPFGQEPPSTLAPDQPASAGTRM